MRCHQRFVPVLLFAVFICANGGFAQSDGAFGRQLIANAAFLASTASYDDARHACLDAANLLLAKGERGGAAEIYVQLGEISQVHGSFQFAEAVYRKALDLLDRSRDPDDFRSVSALDDLGWLYVTWGRYIEGARLLDQARSRADGLPPNDPRLIQHLDTQAAYLVVAGKYSEAQKNWERALEIGKFNFGPDSPKYDGLLVHFGQGSSVYGDYKTAEQLFRRYLAIERKDAPETVQARTVAQAELGHVFAQLHRFSEAWPWFDQSLEAFKGHPQEAPLVHAMILNYLGDFYMDQKDWAPAEAQYREAVILQEKVLGPNNAVAASMISLSKALRKLHSNAEAREWMARAKAIIAAERNPQRQDTVDILALRRQ